MAPIEFMAIVMLENGENCYCPMYTFMFIEILKNGHIT